MFELLNFSLFDMTPYNKEAFFYLIQYYNESVWPWQIPVFIVTGWLLIIWPGKQTQYIKIIFLIFAMAWLTNGLLYHYFFYSSLNWAANYFAYLFISQGLLFLAVIFFSTRSVLAKKNSVINRFSYFLLIMALIIYPLSGFMEGREIIQLESFILSPTPVLIATFALVLLLDHKSQLILSLIPFSWSIITLGLSWKILTLSSYIILAAFILFSFILIVKIIQHYTANS